MCKALIKYVSHFWYFGHRFSVHFYFSLHIHTHFSCVAKRFASLRATFFVYTYYLLFKSTLLIKICASMKTLSLQLTAN